MAARFRLRVRCAPARRRRPHSCSAGPSPQPYCIPCGHASCLQRPVFYLPLPPSFIHSLLRPSQASFSLDFPLFGLASCSLLPRSASVGHWRGDSNPRCTAAYLMTVLLRAGRYCRIVAEIGLLAPLWSSTCFFYHGGPCVPPKFCQQCHGR